MPFLDDLRTARQSPVAAVHEFKINYGLDGAQWHCFVEGQTDQAFYWLAMVRYVPADDVHMYRCGNKKGVLDALAHVTSRYPNFPRVLFFVDKDLSDLVSSESHGVHPQLFVTETYSVENYLATETVLVRVLHELFRVSGASFDFNVPAKAYRESLVSFYRLMTPLMAWIIAVKRAGARPNLGNIQLQRLIVFDDSLRVVRRLSLIDSEQYLCSAVGVSPMVTTKMSWRRALREVSARNPSAIVRGKFVAWFFIQFLTRTEESMRLAAEEVGGSLSVSTLLHARNFVEVLSARAELPPALLSFVSGHVMAIRA